MIARPIGSTNRPIYSNNFERLTEKDAWRQNLQLASIAAGKVASCLGPMGMYKLVTYHRGPELVTKVTKDAVEIVDELGVQYPSVKTLAEAVRIQRHYVGDGASTLLVLISALLVEANLLVTAGIHPVLILDGYSEATKKSIELIDESSQNIQHVQEKLLNVVDCGRGFLNETLRRDLIEALQFVDANDPVVDVSRVGIVKKPGGIIGDSRLVHGLIVRKGKVHPNMPDEMTSLRIAIITKPLDIKPLELIARNEGSPNKLLNMTQDGDIHRFKDEEYKLRKKIVEQIKNAGANVVFCRSKIDDRIAHLLCQYDIFASSMVDEKQLDEIAKATGANIIADPSLLTSQDIGHGEKLEIEKLGPDQMTIVHTKNNAASLLLRGSNPEILQELEKIVKKSLLILKHVRSNAKIVPGGGAVFEMLSLQLRKFATTFPSRQQLAINSFAYALEKIPEAIARNYGLDPIKTVFELRKEHANGKNTMGIGENGPTDMINMDIVELASVNKATLRRALEVVSLLLRVDSIFQVKELPVFHKQ